MRDNELKSILVNRCKWGLRLRYGKVTTAHLTDECQEKELILAKEGLLKCNTDLENFIEQVDELIADTIYIRNKHHLRSLGESSHPNPSTYELYGWDNHVNEMMVYYDQWMELIK